MAQRIDVSTSTINYWENSHFSPRVQHMQGIVAILDDRPGSGGPLRLCPRTAPGPLLLYGCWSAVADDG